MYTKQPFNVYSLISFITNSWSYYYFQGHIFNISGNCTVDISPKEALSDDYIVTLKVIELYVTCHL